eukprot:7754118-Alexandrium_andersonii.AAC.1
MPRYLAWPWVHMPRVIGAVRHRAASASSRLRGLKSGATAAFEGLSLRLESSAYVSKIFAQRGGSL